ncbi:MAG: hypothetical protein R6V01_03380 [Thermoplasmatota archaeon]
MVFESLKKWFGKNKFEPTPNHQMELIDEELEGIEREIQEYLVYSDESGPAPAQQPEALSRGGARGTSDLITPEEQKRIEEEKS